MFDSFWNKTNVVCSQFVKDIIYNYPVVKHVRWNCKQFCKLTRNVKETFPVNFQNISYTPMNIKEVLPVHIQLHQELIRCIKFSWLFPAPLYSFSNDAANCSTNKVETNNITSGWYGTIPLNYLIILQCFDEDCNWLFTVTPCFYLPLIILPIFIFFI